MFDCMLVKRCDRKLLTCHRQLHLCHHGHFINLRPQDKCHRNLLTWNKIINKEFRISIRFVCRHKTPQSRSSLVCFLELFWGILERFSCLKTHFRRLNHSIDIPAHTLLFQGAINYERWCVVLLIPLFSNAKSKVFRRYQVILVKFKLHEIF